MKKCTKCNTDKVIDEFIKNKNICKVCWSQERKNYYQLNKEKIKVQQLEYYYSNIDKYQKNYIENKEELKNKNSIYYQLNKEKINKQKMIRHKERIIENPLYHISYNIRKLIGVSIRNKNFTKKSKTNDILGCSFEHFKEYLESKFEPWMNWNNYGLYNGDLNYGWDIDHITPLSNATTEEEVVKLNHYTNLQPLCSKVNRDIKKNKVA